MPQSQSTGSWRPPQTSAELSCESRLSLPTQTPFLSLSHSQALGWRTTVIYTYTSAMLLKSRQEVRTHLPFSNITFQYVWHENQHTKRSSQCICTLQGLRCDAEDIVGVDNGFLGFNWTGDIWNHVSSDGLMKIEQSMNHLTGFQPSNFNPLPLLNEPINHNRWDSLARLARHSSYRSSSTVNTNQENTVRIWSRSLLARIACVRSERAGRNIYCSPQAETGCRRGTARR